MNEFVSIDAVGIERGWIDPVVSVKEEGSVYTVDNGVHVYTVFKRKGWTYITRPLQGNRGKDA